MEYFRSCTFPIGKTVRIFPSRFFILCLLFLSICFLIHLSPKEKLHYYQLDFNADSERKELARQSDALLSFLMDSKTNVTDIDGTDFLRNLMTYFHKMKMKIDELEKKISELEKFVAEKNFDGRLQKNSNSECEIPSLDDFPTCQDKLLWMQERWSSDPCYAEWGVNGSDCTILRYLSEIEHWCPRLPGKATLEIPSLSPKMSDPIKLRTNLRGLYQRFGDDIHFKWMRQRAERMEDKWVEAAQTFQNKSYMNNWQRKEVLIHLGLLAEENGWNIARSAFSGGPLGELVQWTDIIVSLYMLGHRITLSVTSLDLKRIFEDHLKSVQSHNCPIKDKLFDIIYTDIRGVQMFKKVAGQKFHLMQCNLRVVDSFGTEPAYNYFPYSSRRKKVSAWGKLGLDPKQFNTMFPHTPDNTFLGFVVDTVNSTRNSSSIARLDRAVVYGKLNSFWEGKGKYLNAIHELVEIHGTVGKQNDMQNVPTYVINHDVLPAHELHNLLRSSKIFVGMGFPYEGPAPLEAIADGAVFLNPVFAKDSELYAKAVQFFEKKPTDRKLKSQHPYAQTFIGPPHVRSLNMDDLETVKNTVKDIITSPPVKGYMPFEFTFAGMMERVAFLVEKQEFCGRRKQWPPLSAMTIIVTDDDSTCTDACLAQGLVCEPHFFPDVNQRSTFKILGINCKQFKTPQGNEEEIDYPAHNDGTCYLQGNHKLFSCAGRYTNARRLCPCRDYVKGQVALCKDCYVS